jgi:hypothetical protein
MLHAVLLPLLSTLMQALPRKVFKESRKSSIYTEKNGDQMLLLESATRSIAYI